MGQPAAFDRGIAAFHARDYAAALPFFQMAAEGENRVMAHSARTHVRICEQRLLAAQPALRTPEELYDYAIALINERKLVQAETYLREALHQAPSGDHLYYAVALCRGLSGDIEGARANLQRAIDLNERNRVIARNDPDFAEIGQLSPLAEVLYSGNTGA